MTSISSPISKGLTYAQINYFETRLDIIKRWRHCCAFRRKMDLWFPCDRTVQPRYEQRSGPGLVEWKRARKEMNARAMSLPTWMRAYYKQMLWTLVCATGPVYGTKKKASYIAV